jgi:phosphoribosylanthranilate isomerase
MKMKVCGMRDPGNIMAVASLAPEYMGFIFYPGSKRFVGPGFHVPDNFPDTIARVGVFVDEPVLRVLEAVKTHALDMIQLHGTESPEYCQELKMKGLKISKAIPVAARSDFKNAEAYGRVVDFFLFDTKGASFGGNGVPFDWKMIQGLEIEIPFFLSGGLSPENAAEAAHVAHPNLYALDINSGVETSPGLKNIERIRQFKTNLSAEAEKLK